MFFSKQRGSAQSVVSSPDGSVWRGLIGSGSNSSGSKVTPESALGVPILQNCVTLLAESAAETALPAMLSCACSALFDHARSWMLFTADCGVSSRKNCA